MSLTERYQLSGSNSNDKLYLLNDLAGWGLQDSTAIDLLPSNRDLLRSAYDTVNSFSCCCRRLRVLFSVS